MRFWNRDGCGYRPEAIVRFVDRERVSQLVVFTARCDSSRVGLLMIQPGAPMEYCELGSGGEGLLDLLARALPEPEQNPFDSEANGANSEATNGGNSEANDDEPTLVTRVDPAYPDFGREKQPQGVVTMNVLVGADGRVQSITIVHGVPELNQAAIEAVKQWGYRPAHSKGRPVAAWTEASLDFHGAPANIPMPLPSFPW